MNPVAALSQQYKQSVWLDYIRRSLIAKGDLRRLVEEDGLGGVTSNPAIFEKAISAGDDYTADIEQTSKDPSLDAKAVFERLAVKDIQDAADVLRPSWQRSEPVAAADPKQIQRQGFRSGVAVAVVSVLALVALALFIVPGRQAPVPAPAVNAPHDNAPAPAATAPGRMLRPALESFSLPPTWSASMLVLMM